MSLENDIETKGISANLILEVLGKPKEHLVETLNNIIGKIKEEKGVIVVDTKINEPVTLKNNEDLFTTFAEVEVKVETIAHMAMLMFKYMPAHIEILSPERLVMSNNGWNDVLNEIVRRLHGYDEVARVIQVEKGILEKKLKTLLDSKDKKE